MEDFFQLFVGSKCLLRWRCQHGPAFDKASSLPNLPKLLTFKFHLSCWKAWTIHNLWVCTYRLMPDINFLREDPHASKFREVCMLEMNWRTYIWHRPLSKRCKISYRFVSAYRGFQRKSNWLAFRTPTMPAVKQTWAATCRFFCL